MFGRVVNRAFMHAALGGVVSDVSGTSAAESHTLPIMEDVFFCYIIK